MSSALSSELRTRFREYIVDSQGSLRRLPLSQFHQFFSEGFGGCPPPQTLSGGTI